MSRATSASMLVVSAMSTLISCLIGESSPKYWARLCMMRRTVLIALTSPVVTLFQSARCIRSRRSSSASRISSDPASRSVRLSARLNAVYAPDGSAYPTVRAMSS